NLTQLGFIDLGANQLTNFTLPAGLTNLSFLYLDDNQLTNLVLPDGLTNLSFLQLSLNQISRLTLPPDMTVLTSLFLDGNPLTTVVLSESLAARLTETISLLRSRGVPVFTYPLSIQLTSPRPTPTGSFDFALTGPPGIYTVFASTDLLTWNQLGTATNDLGNATFTDPTARISAKKFYRARQ